MVPVSNIEKAVAFYKTAFDAVVVPNHVAFAAGAVCLALSDNTGGPTLGIVDEQSYSAAPRRFPYEKGKTPLMEFRVDDVRQWLNRACGAGATMCTSLVIDSDMRLRAPLSDAEVLNYAQFIDPFGHLWALAASEPMH